MKFSVDRDSLWGAVQPPARLSAKYGIRLTVEGEKLSIEATDLDLTIRTTVPARVDDPGAVVLPGKAADVIRALSTGSVDITEDSNNSVLFAQGPHSTSLRTKATNDYPVVPTPQRAQVVHGDALATAIKRVAYAASTDPTSGALVGVYVTQGFDGLRLIAMDRYRFAMVEIDEHPPATDALIPARLLSEFARLGSGEEVTIAVDDRCVSLTSDHGSVTGRLVAVPFPNCRQFIEYVPAYSVELNREELLASVGRVSVLADDAGSHLRLAVEDSHVELSVTSQDYGRSDEAIPATGGEPMVLGVNAKHFRDALEALTDESVLIGYSDPMKLILLRDPSSTTSFMVIAPRVIK